MCCVGFFFSCLYFAYGSKTHTHKCSTSVAITDRERERLGVHDDELVCAQKTGGLVTDIFIYYYKYVMYSIYSIFGAA